MGYVVIIGIIAALSVFSDRKNINPGVLILGAFPFLMFAWAILEHALR